MRPMPNPPPSHSWKPRAPRSGSENLQSGLTGILELNGCLWTHSSDVREMYMHERPTQGAAFTFILQVHA